MTYYHNLLFSIWLCAFLTSVVAIVDESNNGLNNCTNITCPVPLKYYEYLNCKPVYRKGKCCPWRYDCDHLHDLVYKNKCYFNGTKYEIGEKREDTNLCGEECFCKNRWNKFADFNCTSRVRSCPHYKHSLNSCSKGPYHFQCCPELEICQPTKPGCERMGKLYVAGDYLVPEDDEESICQCNKVSEGTYEFACIDFNLNMFPKVGYYKNCVPVFNLIIHETGKLTEDWITWRCYKSGDYIIERHFPGLIEPKRSGYWYVRSTIWYKINHDPLPAIQCASFTQKEFNKSPFKDDGCLLINPRGPQGIQYGLIYRKVCRFGQLSMQIGETLKSAVFSFHSCIVCICHVPPAPTCFIARKYGWLSTPIFPRRFIRC